MVNAAYGDALADAVAFFRDRLDGVPDTELRATLDEAVEYLDHHAGIVSGRIEDEDEGYPPRCWHPLGHNWPSLLTEGAMRCAHCNADGDA